MVGYGGFGEYVWGGEDTKVLILFVSTAFIVLNSVIFSSESCLLALVSSLISSLLGSIAACVMMNCSSDLFSILLLTFGILKLGV